MLMALEPNQYNSIALAARGWGLPKVRSRKKKKSARRHIGKRFPLHGLREVSSIMGEETFESGSVTQETHPKDLPQVHAINAHAGSEDRRAH